jgi:hypothetical protein
MSNGRTLSDADQDKGGKAISDSDQKFIARIERQIAMGEKGKAISDLDQKRYKRLTGKNWPGATIVNDIRDLGPFKKGGSVKKYAKGGGVRKARYK